MIIRDQEIDLDEALPGMTLAGDILDGHGGMLLPSGTALTEANLVSLRRRGIDRVRIVDQASAPADLAAERERLRLRLEKLFRKCRGRGAGDALLQSVMQYRMGQPE